MEPTAAILRDMIVRRVCLYGNVANQNKHVVVVATTKTRVGKRKGIVDDLRLVVDAADVEGRIAATRRDVGDISLSCCRCRSVSKFLGGAPGCGTCFDDREAARRLHGYPC
jgi:hypothetical protein